MKNFRYTIRLTGAFLSKFKGLLFLGIISGVSFFFLFRFVFPKMFGKSYEKIGMTGRFDINSLPLEVTGLIGEGLTTLDESGTPQPAIASSWSTPDGGKTWDFIFDENATWQDGKKITSESLNYSFSDVEIDTSKEKSISFKLKDPFSPFPVVVSKPVFKKGLLSTGKWQVKKATIQSGDIIQSLLLIDSEGNRKEYKFYPTEDRTKLAFKLGEIDYIHNLFSKSPFDEWKTVDIKENVQTGQVVAVFFNTQSELLADKTVRQALDYAINKNNLSPYRAISPLSPESWAYNPQVKNYNYDPDRAKELLGSIEGIEIKLAASPVLLDVAEKIKADWEEIGIKITVQVTSTIPEDYEAFLAIFDIPKDPDQYSIWHSTQTGTNISKFSSARIDKLLEDGRKELNQEDRKKIVLDFQRFLVEDLPAAFLYHPTSYSIIRK